MARVGSKRSDYRYSDDRGVVWDSKFEWEIYCALVAGGCDVRKCVKGPEGDTFDYTTPVRGGSCLGCGSATVVQTRTYTPDIYVSTGPDSEGCYIEVRGRFDAKKRNLIRGFQKTGPDIDLRIVLAADHWVTRGRSRLTDYFEKYLKGVPVMVYRKREQEALMEFVK